MQERTLKTLADRLNYAMHEMGDEPWSVSQSGEYGTTNHMANNIWKC